MFLEKFFATLIFFLLAIFPTLVHGTCIDRAMDCFYEYGKWSDCDPCNFVQSRHVNVTSPAHQSGHPCPDLTEEIRSCTTQVSCVQPPPAGPCPVGYFNCEGVGKCISEFLVCNGDNDCGNHWDEINCTLSQFSRSIETCLVLPALPIINYVGVGYDLAEDKLRSRVVDNQKFNGMCRKVYDGNKNVQYRLPYNLDDIQFDIQTSDDFNAKFYDSLADFTSQTIKEEKLSFGLNFGVSFNIGGFGASIDAGLETPKGKVYKEIHKSASTQDSKIVKISSEIVTSKFLLKGDNLLLEAYFEDSIRRLPKEYDPKTYFDLFRIYGTHFVQAGALGGRYEYYYIYNESDYKTLKEEVSSFQDCVKAHVSASISYANVKGSVGANWFKCDSESYGSGTSNELIDKALHKIVNIEGGTVHMAGMVVAATMQTNRMNESDLGVGSQFSNWFDSVHENPALLYKTLRPICDLIQYSTDKEAQLKLQNCQFALSVYLGPHSTSSCMQCQNGGIALNIDKACKCACPPQFGGPSCSYSYLEQTNTTVSRSNSKSIMSGSKGFTPTRKLQNPNFAETNPDLPVDPLIMTKQLINFITDSNYPPTAHDPPALMKRYVKQYDGYLKTMGERLYLLSSDSGSFGSNSDGTTFGSYSIQEYNDSLSLQSDTPINVSAIRCNGLYCTITDYDIDSVGNVLLTVQTDSGNTSIFMLTKRDGVLRTSIEQPCGITGSETGGTSTGVHVTITCDDQIVISCPSATEPATIRVFDENGYPQRLKQFANYASITSIQLFGDYLWFRTATNQIVAADFNNWNIVKSFIGDIKVEDNQGGRVMEYSQLFIDFLGNLLAAQFTVADADVGGTNANRTKFSIRNLDSDRVLVLVKLKDWAQCSSIVALRFKVFLLCRAKSPADPSAILAFDYLN